LPIDVKTTKIRIKSFFISANLEYQLCDFTPIKKYKSYNG
jgi:hypothetical protein